MSLYLGENCISAGGSSAFRNTNIGEIIQSTIPLSDAGLHLLDGSLINGAGSYSAFVTYIAGLVSNYPDLFITETAWQQAVTDYGVCGKFVYDSTNNTVRLPKITGFTEGTTDVTALGDLIEAGLPNIEGSVVLKGKDTTGMTPTNYTGVFYEGEATTNDLIGGTASSGTQKATLFDASRSSSIYGNSTTVQPQAIKVLYYIVIANSVKTNIEVDIDEIATDLNGKADVDLSNVNVSGTSLASGWSMPSSRYIDLTLGASGATYTAPANGYFLLRRVSTAANQYVSFIVLENNIPCFALGQQYVTSGFIAVNAVPVKKGQKLYMSYSLGSGGSTEDYFRFIYAEGEN